MRKTEGNEYAFAMPASHTEQTGTYDATLGLTKREYFAAMAMQGMIAGTSSSVEVMRALGSQDELIICKSATEYADALIEALNKDGK